jgi:uncharacterized protein HemX
MKNTITVIIICLMSAGVGFWTACSILSNDTNDSVERLQDSIKEKQNYIERQNKIIDSLNVAYQQEQAELDSLDSYLTKQDQYIEQLKQQYNEQQTQIDTTDYYDDYLFIKREVSDTTE